MDGFDTTYTPEYDSEESKMTTKAGELTNEELIKNLHTAEHGTAAAADIMAELWKKNNGLVRLSIHQLTGLKVGDEGFEDMEQQAYFGFHAAAYSFDISGDLKFSTYAVNRIKWELCRYYERNGYTVHIPAYMRTRLKQCAEKQQQLEAETGKTVTIKAALQALNLSPAAADSTLSVYKKLKTASLDAETYTNSEGDSVSLLDILTDGADLEANVINATWQQELHTLLLKALKELPESSRAVIVRRYFRGVSLRQQARTLKTSAQTLFNLEKAGFKSIRAGKYGAELAEFCDTESQMEHAKRQIQRDRATIEKLQLSDSERGLLSL